MSFSDVVKVAAAIIASLGGGGAIVFGLSGYFGKIWADRGLERQRHEYSQLNIAFQNQLDVASRRLQVELDALGLVHKLRTQEEFTRLAALWKHIANVRNSYGLMAQFGNKLLHENEDDVQKRAGAQSRQGFEQHLIDAQIFLSEEMLFVPKHISDLAEKVLNTAAEEVF